jgi:hypothetical protein
VIRKLKTAFAGILGATQAAAGHAADLPPLVLEPTSQWTLDFADERCSLSRSFGNGENAVRLQIDSYGYQNYRMLVSGPSVPKSNRPTDTLRYAFTADKVERDPTTALMGTSNDLPAASFSFVFLPPPKSMAERLKMAPNPDIPSDVYQFRDQLNAISSEFAAGTDAVTLRFTRGSPLEFRLGNMAEPIKSMRLCISDLIKSWGLDPAIQSALLRGPVPLPTTIQKIKQRYPSEMLQKGISAFVPVRIMVDETGKATGCFVQIPNINKEFAETICNGLARRFEPARDKDGHPVASVFGTSVTFLAGS